ncbi:hypothetical protein JCM8547_003705, partial [Rhodosporidiobolus lusitaniae]
NSSLSSRIKSKKVGKSEVEGSKTSGVLAVVTQYTALGPRSPSGERVDLESGQPLQGPGDAVDLEEDRPRSSPGEAVELSEDDVSSCPGEAVDGKVGSATSRSACFTSNSSARPEQDVDRPTSSSVGEIGGISSSSCEASGFVLKGGGC